MPPVLRHGAYRFLFYASDRPEPLHVHVARESAVVEFWLEPVRLARRGGFRGQELVDIQGIVIDNQRQLIGAWHEYFGH
ncbi:MAG: DUF4160 domain-containing protein [Verrucomicrobiales bacterium]|nr:DUF4160 domain-containing protein [Verrucomicrobiales bacterium]